MEHLLNALSLLVVAVAFGATVFVLVILVKVFKMLTEHWREHQ